MRIVLWVMGMSACGIPDEDYNGNGQLPGVDPCEAAADLLATCSGEIPYEDPAYGDCVGAQRCTAECALDAYEAGGCTAIVSSQENADYLSCVGGCGVFGR